MSGSGKKTGKVRDTGHIMPKHQRDLKPDSDKPTSDKPDFDERDSMSSPNRKAAGPGTKRRRRLPPSPGAPSTPDAAQDLNTDVDTHGKDR